MCYTLNDFGDIILKGGEDLSSIMTVRAPTDLQQVLSSRAKNLGLARNALVLQILWDWVERQCREVDKHTS